MGAWGGGIYSSDYALDLKGTINALLRAPLSDDELLAELWTSHGERAVENDALDYWIVLADQLERHGLRRPEIFERATAIVESGADVAALQSLSASASTIASRRRDTAKLLARLRDPRPAKPRRPLKTPQPLLFEVGEAITWPTDGGESINPYVREDQLWRLGGFTQDGWGFGIITDAGRVCGVLAYYAVQVLRWRRPERPAVDLAVHCVRSAHRYGTLTPLRLQRTKLERLGRVPNEAMSPPPSRAIAERSARKAAFEDISLSAAFGIDAWNHWFLGGVKFVYPAPSGTPIDPDAPDQRPGREAR